MRMKILAFLSLFVFSGICLLSAIEAKDLYKILGVDKNASQRDIQKAFHRLSLKYHPDKNKAKDAQAKFSEINNAYEILSDEEKRKNYDLYGDEQGNQGFQGAGPENAGFGSQQFSYGGEQGAHFTFGGAKSRAGGGNEGFQYFNFPFERSSGSESGGSRTFRFSFGGPSMGDSFSMGDAFSSFFGFDFDNVNTRQRHANPFGGTGASKGSQTSEESYQIQSLDSASYASKVSNKGSTWLIMFYNPNSRGYQEMQEILDRLLPSFQGLVKIGTINCQRQHKLCKDLSVMPQKTPKLLIYSVRRDGRGSLLEYTGDLNVKDISRFCLDLLPMLSKRIDSDDLDDLLRASQKQLRLLLLTTKKKTPATWRALSGLFKDRVLFYDAEVPDPSHPIARKLGVKSLPGVLGILSNGEIVALGSEKMAKLAEMVETLEKKNAKVLKENRQSSKDPKETVPLLNKESVNNLCSSNTPLCVIGAFRSSKGKDKIKRFLKVISQKTLTRGGRPFEEVKDPLSYSLLDAAKQTTFLRAFDRSAFKGRDALLIAFKPKRKTFAVCLKPDSLEETEKFVSEALNGDLQFTKVLQQPVLS